MNTREELVRLAAEDDARINVQRAAAGLPPVQSIVLTADQHEQLRSGASLADVLGDPMDDIFGLPSVVVDSVNPTLWTAQETIWSQDFARSRSWRHRGWKWRR